LQFRTVSNATVDLVTLVIPTMAASNLPDPYVNQTLAVPMLSVLSRLTERACAFAQKALVATPLALKDATVTNAKSTMNAMTSERVLVLSAKIPVLAHADMTPTVALRNIIQSVSATLDSLAIHFKPVISSMTELQKILAIPHLVDTTLSARFNARRLFALV
jgi:hypothetical protein